MINRCPIFPLKRDGVSCVVMPNEECYDCKGCDDCKGCWDCTDCKSCVDCEECKECVGCTNCKEGCFRCDYCEGCRDCVNCKGCFALLGKTGWVNNKPPDMPVSGAS